jgi:hypothetical protein
MSTIAARLSSTSGAQARSAGVIDERINLIRTRVGRLTAVSGNIRKATGLNDTSLIELRQNSLRVLDRRLHRSRRGLVRPTRHVRVSTLSVLANRSD